MGAAGVDETPAEWIRRLVGAWGCCGTCAGSVLAEHDARVRAEALRDAANDPGGRLLGHSGVSIRYLRLRADLIEDEARP